MTYTEEPEIRQTEEDSIENCAKLTPVFCQTKLSTEQIKTFIQLTHLGPDWPNQLSLLFLDITNSTPEALAATTHATRHPSPPISHPFDTNWTILDFYTYWRLHFRNDPHDRGGPQKNKFTSFTFFIITPETVDSISSSMSHSSWSEDEDEEFEGLPTTVVCTAPDYYEPDETKIYVKAITVPFRRACEVLDSYEVCVQCVSEYENEQAMSQMPPAILSDVDYGNGNMSGKIATPAQMRMNRIMCGTRKWEEKMESEGKGDEVRRKSEAVRVGVVDADY